MNKSTLHFLLASIGVLLFLSCKKVEEEPIPSFKLQKVRSSTAISQNATYYPRVLGDKVWCTGDGKMTNISCLDASVRSISGPNYLSIKNGAQYSVTYTGSNTKNLYYFNWKNQVWVNPFTAPDGQYIDQCFETEVFGDLLPFVTTDSASKRQDVYSFNFSTKQTSPLFELNDLIKHEQWKLLTQPKITTLKTNGKNEVLLSILAVPNDSKNAYAITYNMSMKKWQSKLDLGSSDFCYLKVVDNSLLAIDPGFLTDSGTLINPETGLQIWKKSASNFRVFNEHLFSSDILGSNYLPLNTDDKGFNFPARVQVSTIASVLEGHFCAIGNEKIDEKHWDYSQIVFINAKNGNVTSRSSIPGIDVFIGPVLSYPDSSFLIVMDDEQKLNFLKVE
jgi:hypothetical protein